jgi:non-canonical purine NTP pyrophosphatase (RdgB/HAM1 family)
VTPFVLATANPHKTREMRDILTALGFDVRARPENAPDVDETSETLEGNALLKAQALALLTGEPVLADDTGLFVDALDGRPGVYSARYAGSGASDADNVAKLLAELNDVPDAMRDARFRSVIAVAYPDGGSFTVEGLLEGSIARSPRGSEGFGYDPVFVPAGASGRTLAELTPEQKNELSHRGRALRALAEKLTSE